MDGQKHVKAGVIDMPDAPMVGQRQTASAISFELIGSV